MKTERKRLSVVNMTGILGPAVSNFESLKSISEVIMEQYDKENCGKLTFRNVETMMRDMYRSMNIDFQPRREEVEHFMRVLDIEKTKVLNEKNIERAAKKYLVTPKIHYLNAVEKKMTSSSSGSIRKELSIYSSESVEGEKDQSPLSTKPTTPVYTPIYNLSKSSQPNLIDTNMLAGRYRASEAEPTEPPKPVAHSGKKLNEADVKTAFSEFDFDKDGKINGFEFQRALMRYGWKFGVNPMKINLESKFNLADSDSDGLISLDEFRGFIETLN